MTLLLLLLSSQSRQSVSFGATVTLLINKRPVMVGEKTSEKHERNNSFVVSMSSQ